MMNKRFSLLLIIISFTLCACSSSRVILLENSKDNNSLIVSTKAGELILDEENTYTEMSKTAAPSAAKSISKEELSQDYGKLIAAAPKPPIKILLYFEPGSTNLTASAQAQLPNVVTAIQERIPCDINIIGHADRTGSKEYNIELSLKRAREIHHWLLEQDLDVSNIFVESYGEEDPLIPTADNVPELRNRRVEILIR